MSELDTTYRAMDIADTSMKFVHIYCMSCTLLRPIKYHICNVFSRINIYFLPSIVYTGNLNDFNLASWTYIAFKITPSIF